MTHQEVVSKFKADAVKVRWLCFFLVRGDGAFATPNVPEAELLTWLSAGGGAAAGFVGAQLKDKMVHVVTRPFDESPRTAMLLAGMVKMLSPGTHDATWHERALLKLRELLAGAGRKRELSN